MSYTQLTQEHRYQIYALVIMAHNRTEIAKCFDAPYATFTALLF